jgi:hypothetical protein
MRLFAGNDLIRSALVMRLVNLGLFVGLATALAVLLPASRRQTLLWGWLVSLVPLGVFLIPSNNPSGWAITGVGTAFLALLGWFESSGRRRWALGALYVVGIVMAAGARGDGAVYVAGATVVASLLTWSRQRDWFLRSILPTAGLIVIVLLFLTSTQGGVGLEGFTATSPVLGPGAGVGDGSAGVHGGIGLAAYNLVMLPLLWTGVWGTWPLGWFDTKLPAIVPWSAVAAFVVVAFAGLGLVTKRKAVAIAGIFAVLVVLPVYVLTAGGDQVGSQLQPRYLLPLIVLFSLVLVTAPTGSSTVRFTRVQTVAILGALAIANVVSLQVNIRRYVTGAKRQGFNLGSGANWWWHGVPFGPMAVWFVGSAAFVGLLVVLWPELRRKVVAP